MKFADLVAADATDPASLRAAHARAEQAARDAAGEIERLTAERAAALIADDERGLDRIEAKIAAERRSLDRADLAAAELEKRLAAAEQAERQARLDGLHAEAVAAQERGVAVVRNRYRKAAEALVRVLGELDDCEMAIEDVNRQLAAAGDPRRVQSPDHLVRPKRLPGIGTLTQATEIFAADDAETRLWPPMPLASAGGVAP